MSNFGNEPHTGHCPVNTSETKAHSIKSEDVKVMVDVKQFSPEDVEVKVVDNFVIIHGKHGEKPDQHGLVSRKFTRRFKLPDGADPNTVTATWREDGVLVVIVPPKSPANERDVPIILAKPEYKNARLEELDEMLRVNKQRLLESHNRIRNGQQFHD